MASPNSVFTEIVTTTLRNHPKELADNVTKNNAFLTYLKKNGNIEMLTGGYELVEPLNYAENSTYQRLSGYDTLNVSASDVLSAAKFDWKVAAVHVTENGTNIRNNMGEAQLIKLVKSKVNNAKDTAANNMSIDLYSDGTADGGKQINGLQALISDAGTGTVGGINSSNFTFWQNVVQSAASPLQGGGSVTVSKATIKSLMNPLWLALCRGIDHPDLILASNDYFTFYEESLQDNQRYMDSEKASAGFTSLRYKDANVLFDGGTQGGGIPNSRMYFVNTKYMHLKVHQDANWTAGEQQASINQDAVVIPVLWQGNLTCGNRSLQGVIKP